MTDLDALFSALADPTRRAIVARLTEGPAGVEELRSAQEVDAILPSQGTTLVVVNSVCGCAAGNARPASEHSPAKCMSARSRSAMAVVSGAPETNADFSTARSSSGGGAMVWPGRR